LCTGLFLQEVGGGREAAECVPKARGFIKFGKDFLADVSFHSSVILSLLVSASLETELRGCWIEFGDTFIGL
jgi:hypothetical protein